MFLRLPVLPILSPFSLFPHHYPPSFLPPSPSSFFASLSVSASPCGPSLLSVAASLQQAYLTAWTYAKSHLPSTPPTTPKEEALRQFVDNWTCQEFVEFVDNCRTVVDGLDIDPESEIGRKAEEVGFWVLMECLVR